MKLKQIWNNKYVKLGTKLLFTGICFYVVYLKIDFVEIGVILKSADLIWVVLATLFFILSKYISAIRLKLFFDLIHLPISSMLNIKLYLLGMFYNLFLPGGIGGDGYKAYYLRRMNKEVSFRKIVFALIFDRINGLIVLCILMLFLFHFIEIDFHYKNALSIIVSIGLLLFLFFSMKFFLLESVRKYFLLLVYSLGVQVSQLIAALCLIFSLHIYENIIEIAFVFLVSTLTVMVPITIGGTGIRELTFIYFTKYFHYDKDYTVTLAVLFFIITSLVSLLGAYYSLKPEKLNA
jgi:uncharacterized membrane protein YbhN (UPF0104 family)